MPKASNATIEPHAKTAEALEALVDRIEANPGKLISPGALEAKECDVDIVQLTASLPAGLGEEDLVGILRLALLTESATESYGAKIQQCAEDAGAAWLGRFNQRIWVPDESTHYLPYKRMLLGLGWAEETLDRDIRDTREKEYVHYGGDLPIHMTTFAMIQEFLTDTYHGLIAGLLRPTAPLAAQMVMEVKRRETLHTVWYRDMTALQIEGNPDYVVEVAEQVSQFEMPSLSLVPELHQQGMRWQQAMGVEPEKTLRQLVRCIHEALGDVRLTGEMMVRIGASQNVQMGPISASQINGILQRIGGVGYGLIGEAVLERIGLGYLFRRRAASIGGYEQLRSVARSWLASRLPDPTAFAMR